MIDYAKAAQKATETILNYNLNPEKADALSVMKALSNVLLISYETSQINESDTAIEINQDAMSLVNNADGNLQYIVIYNRNTDPERLKMAFARELGHVMLDHDGSSPEEVWEEEASAFAHHFLYPAALLQPHPRSCIIFRPQRTSISSEMKDVQEFDSIDDMKLYIADYWNKYSSFVGRNSKYEPGDVRLQEQCYHDKLTGWKNCFSVVLDGRTVGYCGE